MQSTRIARQVHETRNAKTSAGAAAIENHGNDGAEVRRSFRVLQFDAFSKTNLRVIGGEI